MSTPALAQATPAMRRPIGRTYGSPALRLIGKRLATALPVLWGVTFLTFLVVNRLPGDAAQQLLGINATQQQIAELRAKLNLDEPFLTRYFHWVGHAVTGDLGSSFASDQSVTSILSERLPVTFELLAYALIVSLLFTVPVALIAARRPNGVIDRLTMAISMAGLSVANYVLALLLVYVFAVKLDVLPAIGYVNPSDGLWPFIKSLTLPAISIGFPLSASTRACCARTSSSRCRARTTSSPQRRRASGRGACSCATRCPTRSSASSPS